MPNSHVERLPNQRAPHRSTPRQAAVEGAVLVFVGLLCLLLALKVF
jgi:hypothetical protein